MGKKKKSSKNSFFYFMNDYIQCERSKGRNISCRIAAEECDLKWRELSKEKRENYKQIAAANKVKCNSDKDYKFTSTGVSFAQMEREIQMAQERIEKEDKEIETTIFNLDYDLLKTQLFYIVHCNYYCKTQEDIYLPGEIAISEFSLGDGIRRHYHTLISPESIPLGFALETQTNIDKIHGLRYPPYPEGSSDYSAIYYDIIKFLTARKLPDGKIPPLYCIEKNISASKNIFDVLAENDKNEKNHFRIYLLHKLFFFLKNKCVQFSDEKKNSIGFPVMWNAINEIEKDEFFYLTGISCTYHCNMEDKYQNCSLSIVQRLVYVICDHCCKYINVKLVPGKHIRMYPASVENIITLDIKKYSKSKEKQVKKAGALCSFYGGNDVPERTKITSGNFLDSSFERLSKSMENIFLSSKSEDEPILITTDRGKFKNKKKFPDFVGRGRIFKP